MAYRIENPCSDIYTPVHFPGAPVPKIGRTSSVDPHDDIPLKVATVAGVVATLIRERHYEELSDVGYQQLFEDALREQPSADVMLDNRRALSVAVRLRLVNEGIMQLVLSRSRDIALPKGFDDSDRTMPEIVSDQAAFRNLVEAIHTFAST